MVKLLISNFFINLTKQTSYNKKSTRKSHFNDIQCLFSIVQRFYELVSCENVEQFRHNLKQFDLNKIIVSKMFFFYLVINITTTKQLKII